MGLFFNLKLRIVPRSVVDVISGKVKILNTQNVGPLTGVPSLLVMILARKAHDVEITAGKDVAFATATGRCAGVDLNGKREELQFRLTMGLGKIDGSGVIREHHSLPAE